LRQQAQRLVLQWGVVFHRHQAACLWWPHYQQALHQGRALRPVLHFSHNQSLGLLLVGQLQWFRLRRLPSSAHPALEILAACLAR
jgi:hypothetical protein